MGRSLLLRQNGTGAVLPLFYPKLPVPADKRIGRAIMRKLRFVGALKLRNDPVSQHFPKFDAPLIERVDIPDGTLNEDFVLVERNYFAQRLRCQARCENRVRRAITLEGTVWNLECRDSFCGDFLCCLPEGQGLGLSEEVSHQQIVVPPKRVEGLTEPDEIARDQLGPLVDELVERMLAVGSGLPPDNRPRLVVHPPALQVDALPIALHIELLEVGRQTSKVIVIGQDRHGFSTEEVVIPDANQPQEDRQVALKRSGAEMFIHCVEASEHLAKLLRANSDHQGKADR